MKTRAKPATKSEKETSGSISSLSTTKYVLNPEAVDPPQLFILPDDLSNEARIIQLQHPRNGTQSPYVVCPERGFYELTEVSPPKTTPRSWLLSGDSASVDQEDGKPSEIIANEKDQFSAAGYVLRNANLFIATPIDSLFFALPALAPAPRNSEPQKKLFLSSEDYFERITSTSPQISAFLKVESIGASIEKRIASICDTVEAGDEIMYRISEAKLLAELLNKAKKMAEGGLTTSMEERFIKKPLEVPTIIVTNEETSVVSEGVTPAASGLSTPPVNTPDTQTTDTSAGSSSTSISAASTAASSFSDDCPSKVLIEAPATPPINAPNGVADLLRLRTALFFLCSKYIPHHLSESIKLSLSSPSSGIDFRPLDTHLEHLAKLRQEVLAAKSLGDISRKRSMLDDGEDGESQAEKRRKIEEEEKRKKASESRGVKNLKKVNVSGMKKMSDFFTKK